MKRIGIAGAAGRMGCALVRAVKARPELTLAAAWERPGHAAVGRDTGEWAGLEAAGVQILDRPDFTVCDVLIDFTAPEATVALAQAATGKCNLVIGTTGLNAAQVKVLQGAGERSGVVYASNFSLGVNLLAILAEKAAAALNANYDMEIIEAHHNQKKDAPSGTALTLYQALCRGRGLDPATSEKYRGHEVTGARPQSEVGLHAVRGGDIVGDHTILFAGPGERLEFKHQAHSRDVFAHGAAGAAAWLAGKAAGWYSMADVLGLNAQ
ncbi:MAG: 4-hydroxy-tetrahydrodipicolinate reductase [Candidatus Firestonebacteria bacterium]|nr:4-hydroxy-tetrahydrodipicolinate reductase [Candidatus Firestonebacteria bacterium]